MIYLSKILPLVVYPLTLCLFLSLLGVLVAWRRKKIGLGLVFAAMALLWISSTSVVSKSFRSWFEGQHLPVPLENIAQSDALIVLGGCVGAAVPPRLDMDLYNTSDRIRYAAKLFGTGKARVVIASGGTISWLGSEEPEAGPMSMLLQEWGVPGERIILEAKSQNTRQNAVNSKKIMAARGLESGLLVTSALHMPRALKTFQASGVAVVPAPTDFTVVERKERTLWDLIPQAGALEGTTSALKETVGLIYYWLRGWIDSPLP